jgi:AraC family transcriptional regulator, alkane utilization regulator
MDVLSDLLTTGRLQSSIHFCPDVSAPWGFQVSAQNDRAVFYVLSRGSCYLEIEGLAGAIALVGGDLVMLPQGVGHSLRDQLQTPATPLGELLQGGCLSEQPRMLRHGGGGARSALVAGYFQFENRMTHHFLGALPSVIHIQAEDGQSVPWLEATLKFLAAESSSEGPGAQILVARLTDVLFIQILRAHIAQDAKGTHTCENKASLLRGLIDPQIGKALALIHQQPHRAWTIASLAEEVGMSRTSFAMHFAAMTGFAPFDYIRKWRMQKAGEMLRQGEENLEEIAGRVGYESGAAFSKAFKREMGTPPGLYRKERLTPASSTP